MQTREDLHSLHVFSIFFLFAHAPSKKKPLLRKQHLLGAAREAMFLHQCFLREFAPFPATQFPTQTFLSSDILTATSEAGVQTNFSKYK